MYSTKYHQYSQRKIQQTIKNNHTPRCFPHRGYFFCGICTENRGLFHSSTPRFYALQHISCRFSKNSCIFPWRFQLFFLPLPTLNKMIVVYPAGRPFRLWLIAAGFFYAQEYHFADISKKVYLYGGCMNRKI